MTITRTKLSHFGQEETLLIDATGSGDITAGSFLLIRQNGIVTIQSSTSAGFTHSSNAQSSTAVGIVPERFRPKNNYTQPYKSDISGHREITIKSDGQISFDYRDSDSVSVNKTVTGDFKTTYALED